MADKIYHDITTRLASDEANTIVTGTSTGLNGYWLDNKIDTISNNISGTIELETEKSKRDYIIYFNQNSLHCYKFSCHKDFSYGDIIRIEDTDFRVIEAPVYDVKNDVTYLVIDENKRKINNTQLLTDVVANRRNKTLSFNDVGIDKSFIEYYSLPDYLIKFLYDENIELENFKNECNEFTWATSDRSIILTFSTYITLSNDLGFIKWKNREVNEDTIKLTFLYETSSKPNTVGYYLGKEGLLEFKYRIANYLHDKYCDDALCSYNLEIFSDNMWEEYEHSKYLSKAEKIIEKFYNDKEKIIDFLECCENIVLKD